MESFSKCLAVILAVLLLILAPVRAAARIQERRESEWFENRVREFAEETKRRGYLDLSRYERFCKDIGNSGVLWEVELIHAREKTGIREEVRTGNGIREDRMARMSFNEENRSHTHTSDCYTHTHTELTDDPGGRYYCTHTHSAECRSGGWSRIHFTVCGWCNLTIEMYQFNYNQSGQLTDSTPLYLPSGSRCPVCGRGLSGQKYSWRFYYSCGYSASVITDSVSVPASMKTPVPGSVQSGWFRNPLDGYTFGCYRYSVHSHEAEQCEKYLRKRTVPVICRKCGGIVGALVYEYDRNQTITGSYQPDEVYACCGAGSEADFGRTIEEYTYLCGLDSGWELICGKEVEAVTPVCDRVMLSLEPVTPGQTVYVGEAPDTQVYVNCLSGRRYTCKADTDFTADAPGTYEVSLYLEGYVENAGTQGRIGTAVTVTVIAREKKCDNGHTYRLEADGSDPGCPICRVTPERLEAVLERTEIYKGEEIPVESVAVTYLDGHTEHISEGYEISYDNTRTGNVNVTISYEGVRQIVSVLVRPNLTGVSAFPSSQNVIKYGEPGFLVTARYEDGSSRTVSEYELEGIRTDQVGVQKGRIRCQENGREVSCEVLVTVLPLSATCAYGHVYDRDADDVSWGCPTCRKTITGIEAAPSPIYGRIGDPLEITVIALYQDGHTEEIRNYESSYDAYHRGRQEVVIRYQGFEAAAEVILDEYISCPFCGREMRAEEDCDYCGRLPVRLLAEPPEQTIAPDEEPKFLVYAEYSNGYKERVIGYRHTFRQGITGIQTVEIFYGGLKTTVLVLVQDTGKYRCPSCGRESDRSGKEEVCPYCSRELVRIEAEPEGGNTVRKGTDLKARVILFYRAGNQEIIYSGYTVRNYDPMRIGVQNVEIWYQEKKAGMQIEVVEIPVEAECEEGHRYFLNPDGTDPGCPYCGSLEEETKDYLDIYYTAQIIEVLEQEGRYPLQKGDYFGIRLAKQSGSFAERLAALFWGGEGNPGRQIRYSVMIGEGEKQSGGI